MVIYSFLIKILVKSHFLLMKRVFFCVDLHKINSNDYNNSYEDDMDTTIHDKILGWCLGVIYLKNVKHLKKSR